MRQLDDISFALAHEPCGQPKLVAKTLHQPHPAEVGKVAFSEGKMDRTSAFGYSPQNTLTGAFVWRPFSWPHASFSPGKTIISRAKTYYIRAFLRIMERNSHQFTYAA